MEIRKKLKDCNALLYGILSIIERPRNQSGCALTGSVLGMSG